MELIGIRPLPTGKGIQTDDFNFQADITNSKPEHTCTICLGVPLLKARQCTRCNNLFCCHCISSMSKKNLCLEEILKCPTCRLSWTKLYDEESKVSASEFKSVPGLRWIFQKELEEIYKGYCFECNFCAKRNICVEKIYPHYENCKKKCAYCEQFLTKDFWENHNNHTLESKCNCPEKILSCRYSDYGCDVRLKLDEFSTKHLLSRHCIGYRNFSRELEFTRLYTQIASETEKLSENLTGRDCFEFIRPTSDPNSIQEKQLDGYKITLSMYLAQIVTLRKNVYDILQKINPIDYRYNSIKLFSLTENYFLCNSKLIYEKPLKDWLQQLEAIPESEEEQVNTLESIKCDFLNNYNNKEIEEMRKSSIFPSIVLDYLIDSDNSISSKQVVQALASYRTNIINDLQNKENSLVIVIDGKAEEDSEEGKSINENDDESLSESEQEKKTLLRIEQREEKSPPNREELSDSSCESSGESEHSINSTEGTSKKRKFTCSEISKNLRVKITDSGIRQ